MKSHWAMICFIIFFSASRTDCQRNDSYFTGYLCFGMGPGTTIDFNPKFNGFKSAYRVGIVADRSLIEKTSVHIGIFLSSRGSRWIEHVDFIGGGSAANTYQIDIYAFDVPVIMQINSGINRIKNLDYTFGIINSFLPISPKVINEGALVSLQDNVFRKYNFAACIGLGYEFLNRFIVSAELSGFLFPLVKRPYSEIFEEKTLYYNSGIYPCELFISIYCKIGR